MSVTSDIFSTSCEKGRENLKSMHLQMTYFKIESKRENEKLFPHNKSLKLKKDL